MKQVGRPRARTGEPAGRNSGRGAGGDVDTAVGHELAPAFEHIASPVGSFDAVAIDVRKGKLADLPRHVRTLGRSLAKLDRKVCGTHRCQVLAGAGQRAGAEHAAGRRGEDEPARVSDFMRLHRGQPPLNQKAAPGGRASPSCVPAAPSRWRRPHRLRPTAPCGTRAAVALYYRARKRGHGWGPRPALATLPSRRMLCAQVLVVVGLSRGGVERSPIRPVGSGIVRLEDPPRLPSELLDTAAASYSSRLRSVRDCPAEISSMAVSLTNSTGTTSASPASSSKTMRGSPVCSLTATSRLRSC